MMPALWHDSPNDVRCLCWFSAGSLDARVATSDDCGITTRTRKILSRKTPAATAAARSLSPSCSCYKAKSTAPPPRFITRTPEPAAKSP
jgi:hypothetical protein